MKGDVSSEEKDYRTDDKEKTKNKEKGRQERHGKKIAFLLFSFVPFRRCPSYGYNESYMQNLRTTPGISFSMHV